MANNTKINAATVVGGDDIATLDVGGVKHEQVVTEFLDGGGNPAMVSATDPMPVTDAVAEAALNSIAAEDFATQATLLDIYNKLLATIAVTGSFLTDVQLRATPVPISGTVAVTGGGDATAANQVTGNNSLASILAKIIAAPSTEAKQDTIITALATLLTISDFDTKTGSLTETAPGTDTASSGLNGRLQRIAQRLTSLITALGSPFQAGGSIANTSFASTIADGANVVEGASADAIVAAGATGSISAKLRRATQGLEDLKTLIVLAAGTNLIGKVGIDQTTPGTTNGVQVNNTVTTTEAVSTTIFNGKTTVTVATTRVVLAASQAVKSVTIKALSANTGFIYVGNASVSAANGFQLMAGDSISLDLANLNTVNIDASVSGESVTYIGIN